ncbi:biosynthetic-type acetolactate synthase large subunit [Cyclobacterium marinum]|uniref:Acetolactate synthase n=1 Tax=Cyclobacterium marinum (strain ATCC 25205 / DSM 745 / LMG 13164 / NCIMB 1802) TaxID=880070 RepID=G0J6S0_CYCMS|nr:biosynthetic-type acetolactate synthase large subunit [Cyclobacterium marinum]AEL26118.1 acetolactate synthase, large subunit, biosynthetic type [Cyclobacterium marinum DSM 745]MBI0399475.1 biosynthetic-type acetolactate synthase large subunit [Cyclobacterium marinum]MBR9774805.1 biosynthetic-type acetolactate synthase large subunit [Cytophagales bacterium]|tara:strand:+ start:12464 stop:14158 length:1695 start_codon:yes stop_codon:yes gene_type:complete
MNDSQIRGAEIVIKSLVAENAKFIFGYPGGAIMPVYDALYDYMDQIQHILTRHEQGAIHAAQGYARVSGKVGVCMATSGPGATNLITGMADALIDSTPLVCITGQVLSPLLGTDAFQETDVVGISMPATKWNIQVRRVEDIAPAIAKGFHIARSGRPGPVLIDITKDAQVALGDYNYVPCLNIRSYRPYPKVEDSVIDAAAKLINNAKRPYLLYGQGVILGKAESQLKAFLDKTGIPAACTLLGTGALSEEHPNYVGKLGMHGNYAPNMLTNKCDVLISVGMRFDDRVTGDVKRYAKQAKVIHLELDPAEINKIVKAEVPILGDCKVSLEKLVEKVDKKEHPEWFKQFRELEAEEKRVVVGNDLSPTKNGLTMGEVIRHINEFKADDAILVTDVGQHQMVAWRYFEYKNSRTQVTSGGLGTMGFSLPAALGAQLHDYSKEVICVVGDGGIQMTIQELGAIMQTKAPVKVVLLNNNFLGMVRQWQQLFFDKRYSFTELDNPDFIKIAEAYNFKVQKVDERAELRQAVAEMFVHDGPYFLEVKVEKEDNVFPMIATGSSVEEVRLK